MREVDGILCKIHYTLGLLRQVGAHRFSKRSIWLSVGALQLEQNLKFWWQKNCHEDYII